MPTTQLRILLVEDDEVDAEASRRALMRPDTVAEVRHVDSLIDALDTLGREQFDCVLLDLGLPDASGLAACDAITAHPSATPVVVLTGTDDNATALEAMRRGAQDFLIKGSEPATIARSVHFAVLRHLSDMHDADLRDRVIEIERNATLQSAHQRPANVGAETEDDAIAIFLADNPMNDTPGDAPRAPNR